MKWVTGKDLLGKELLELVPRGWWHQVERMRTWGVPPSRRRCVNKHSKDGRGMGSHMKENHFLPLENESVGPWLFQPLSIWIPVQADYRLCVYILPWRIRSTQPCEMVVTFIVQASLLVRLSPLLPAAQISEAYLLLAWEVHLSFSLCKGNMETVLLPLMRIFPGRGNGGSLARGKGEQILQGRDCACSRGIRWLVVITA